MSVIIGAAVGIFAKGIMNMIAGIPFWYGMGKAALMGAISGAISFGIGAEATNAFGEALSVGKALFEAGMHGMSSGMMSVIEGGEYLSGMLSGAVSSLISSGVNALGTNFSATKAAGSTVYNGFGQNYMKAAMLVAGGFSGGLSSTIAGGKFIDGFKQGLISSGLNHMAHLGAAAIEENTAKNKLEKKLVDSGINDNCSITEALALLKIVFKDMWDLGSGWAKFADEADAISEWESNDSQKISITKFNNLKAGSGKPALGLTNGKGQMLYVASLYAQSVSNFTEVFLHELVHSIDYMSGFYNAFWTLPNIDALMEYRAYKYVNNWTGKLDVNQNNFQSEMGYVPKFLLNYSF